MMGGRRCINCAEPFKKDFLPKLCLCHTNRTFAGIDSHMRLSRIKVQCYSFFFFADEIFSFSNYFPPLPFPFPLSSANKVNILQILISVITEGRVLLPKRMNFRKTSKGGVIFNPRIYAADFEPIYSFFRTFSEKKYNIIFPK